MAPQPNYAKGVAYWETQEASVNGVLGGYGPQSQVPRIDSLTSRQFLLSLFPELSTIPPMINVSKNRLETPGDRESRSRPRSLSKSQSGLEPPFIAFDVGAGIGRVTRDVLLPLFDQVVLVEPVEKFIRKAREDAESETGGWKLLTVSGDSDSKKGRRPKRVEFINQSLQGLTPFNKDDASKTIAILGTGEGPPSNAKATVIWCQWCLGHLSDTDLISFLRRCRSSLRPGGYIIVKENICAEEPNEHGKVERLFDEQDSSWTRSIVLFKDLFHRAGYAVRRQEIQRGFPEELYRVEMFALQ